MLPLAADEDLHGAIILGLRRPEPGIDLVLVRDVTLQDRADPHVLAWTAAEGRVLVTPDARTMPRHALDRVAAGLPMPGLIVRKKGVAIRQAIQDLLIVAICGLPEDFKDQITYLPL